jgi:hypothetical protein
MFECTKANLGKRAATLARRYKKLPPYMKMELIKEELLTLIKEEEKWKNTEK